MNLEQKGNVIYKDGLPFAVLNTEKEARRLLAVFTCLDYYNISLYDTSLKQAATEFKALINNY